MCCEQLAAVQQENMYYGYTMPQVPAEMSMAVGPEQMVLPTVSDVSVTVPDLLVNSKLDPQSVAKRLKERYDE